jgi:hypothetical protein
MDLKQYKQQKQRSPVVLVLSITLTLFLVVIVYKNLHGPTPIPQQESLTQIILTTTPKNYPDSIFPVVLVKDKIAIQAFTASIPKDTTFTMALTAGLNTFKLLDKRYHVVSADSIFYRNEKVVFINF